MAQWCLFGGMREGIFELGVKITLKMYIVYTFRV